MSIFIIRKNIRNLSRTVSKLTNDNLNYKYENKPLNSTKLDEIGYLTKLDEIGYLTGTILCLIIILFLYKFFGKRK